jgi:hypothetical protein
LQADFIKVSKKSMSDSIWDLPENQSGSTSNTKFLSSLGDGDEVVKLKFTSKSQRQQKETTPVDMRTPDGMETVFFFQDEAGEEKEITQKSAKGKFFCAMRDARVEIGDVVDIEREGVGMETKWIITPHNPLK